MKGLDTNVLLRYFLKDDAVQSPAAHRILHAFTPAQPGWIGIPVVLELAWVLKSRTRAPRSMIASVLDQLLAQRELIVEQASLVAEAVQNYRAGNADFADSLIAAAARAAGCTQVVTFDRVAARDAGMTLLE